MHLNLTRYTSELQVKTTSKRYQFFNYCTVNLNDGDYHLTLQIFTNSFRVCRLQVDLKFRIGSSVE